MSIRVCTRLHYFYCPSPVFTTSLLVGNKQSLCPLNVRGIREKWVGTSKNFRPALGAGIVHPPLANCFRRHCVCRNHWASSIRPVLLPSKMIKSTDYRHRGHTAIYQDKPIVTWIHSTFHSPPLDNLYRPVKVHTRLWKIAVTLRRYCGTAGRAGPGRAVPKLAAGRAGPGRAAKWPGICGPGRAGPGRAGPKIFGPCTSLVQRVRGKAVTVDDWE